MQKSLFSKIPEDAETILKDFDLLIQKKFNLNSKHRNQLLKNIQELSHQLTDERSTRRIGYMNNAPFLSAYCYYFMWWNLYRLVNLFSTMDSEAFAHLKDNSVIIDFGAGPLTVVIALYLARPELRKIKLTCYCVDISQNALAVGEELYLSVVSQINTLTNENSDSEFCEPWIIKKIKGTFGTEIKQKADLITSANMFNEIYWNSPKTLEEHVKTISTTLLSYTDQSVKNTILLIEPGIPRGSRFISLFRDNLIRKKYTIVSPCTHHEKCCMDGKKGGKWCHFILPTSKAPKKLLTISDKANLSKDRASLSFVVATSQYIKETPKISPMRIVSDSIRLPFGIGKYACSDKGLTLIIDNKNTLHFGDCIEAFVSKDLPKDKKTNALIINKFTKI